MVIDSHPLPQADDILADCLKGKIWATIDMTHLFSQMKVHPDDIHLTAVTTPFGLYEWTVMPMGYWNALGIHRCCVQWRSNEMQLIKFEISQQLMLQFE